MASRAMLTAGSILTLLYALAATAYFARGGMGHGEVVPDDGVTRYEVVTESGQRHVVQQQSGDPADLMLEATGKYGAVVSMQRLNPGDKLFDADPNARRRAAAIAGTLLLMPIGMLVLGWRARGRENRRQLVWRFIMPTLTVDARSLLRQVPVGEPALQLALDQINTAGLAMLAWDHDANRIYDRRLSDHTLSVQFCSHCQDAVNLRCYADLRRIPQCPACHSPISVEALTHLSAPLVRTLQETSTDTDDGQFSSATFWTLALLFPPAALVYGLRHS